MSYEGSYVFSGTGAEWGILVQNEGMLPSGECNYQILGSPAVMLAAKTFGINSHVVCERCRVVWWKVINKCRVSKQKHFSRVYEATEITQGNAVCSGKEASWMKQYPVAVPVES